MLPVGKTLGIIGFQLVDYHMVTCNHHLHSSVWYGNIVFNSLKNLILFKTTLKPLLQIAVLIPGLLIQLKDETTSDSTHTSKVIGELAFTLMHHFPGYPDVYEKVLSSLQVRNLKIIILHYLPTKAYFILNQVFSIYLT